MVQRIATKQGKYEEWLVHLASSEGDRWRRTSSSEQLEISLPRSVCANSFGTRQMIAQSWLGRLSMGMGGWETGVLSPPLWRRTTRSKLGESRFAKRCLGSYAILAWSRCRRLSGKQKSHDFRPTSLTALILNNLRWMSSIWFQRSLVYRMHQFRTQTRNTKQLRCIMSMGEIVVSIFVGGELTIIRPRVHEFLKEMNREALSS